MEGQLAMFMISLGIIQKHYKTKFIFKAIKRPFKVYKAHSRVLVGVSDTQAMNMAFIAS